MEAFVITKSLEELDAGWKQLIQKATEATQHSYAPYSSFCVGTAILLHDGTIITGTNQENAAYPSGMCAERVALFSASSLKPGISIQKLVVVARRQSGNQLVPATCCGSCRQVILEFESRQENPIMITMMGSNEEWITASSAASLLPFAFDKKNLHS